MYCMECGGEIPENGQFCPACGIGAPQRAPAQPGPTAWPPPSMSPYQQPAYPAQGYAPYPYYQAPPFYPAQPGYPPAWASAPAPSYVVVPMANPLPQKPPLGKRIRDRYEVYVTQAGDNRLETGLSITAAAIVVVGVSAMLLTSL